MISENGRPTKMLNCLPR